MAIEHSLPSDRYVRGTVVRQLLQSVSGLSRLTIAQDAWSLARTVCVPLAPLPLPFRSLSLPLPTVDRDPSCTFRDPSVYVVHRQPCDLDERVAADRQEDRGVDDEMAEGLVANSEDELETVQLVIAFAKAHEP
jgi:hypothetical protein